MPQNVLRGFSGSMSSRSGNEERGGRTADRPETLWRRKNTTSSSQFLADNQHRPMSALVFLTEDPKRRNENFSGIVSRAHLRCVLFLYIFALNELQESEICIM